MSGTLFYFLSASPNAAYFAVSVFLMMLTIMWGWLLLKSVVAQNTPANAVLVPGLRKRLMQTILLPWLALPLMIAVTLSWTRLPFDLTFLLALLGMLLVSLATRFRWMGFLPLAWVVSHAMLEKLLPSPGELLAALGHASAVALGIGVDIVLGAIALRMLFPAGGDRHWQWHGEMARTAQALKNGKLSSQASQPNRIGKLYGLGYRSSLQRDCSNGAPAGRLILYVFGVECHWSGLLFTPCIFLLCAIGLKLWGGLGQGNGYTPLIVCLVLLYMMLPVMMFVSSLYYSMRRTTAEQALLRLAPVMPQGQALNRALGAVLLKRLLFAWAVSALSGVLALLAAGIDFEYVVFSLGGAFASLLVAGFVLADFSALSESRAALARILTIAVPMLLTGVFFGIRVFWFALPIPVFGGVCVAVSALVIGLRWKSMVRAPAAFPAGRFS